MKCKCTLHLTVHWFAILQQCEYKVIFRILQFLVYCIPLYDLFLLLILVTNCFQRLDLAPNYHLTGKCRTNLRWYDSHLSIKRFTEC